jgi:glucose uptake protein
MTLPHTYGAALALTILSMMCWGSWPNVLKIAKGWRFELLYYDYSFGVRLAAVVVGLTFGTSGADGRPFLADLSRAGGTNLLCGMTGGILFNLANILIVGAMSVAGLGVGFPVGVGLALVVGVIWNYLVNPQGNPILLFMGVTLIVGAIVADAQAYTIHEAAKTAGGTTLDQAPKGSTWKGIVLSIVGGILMGTFHPLVEIGKKGEGGLGSYAISFVFAVGVLVSTFVFNLYFMRFPIQGACLSFRDYLSGTSRQHVLGVAGARCGSSVPFQTSWQPVRLVNCRLAQRSVTPSDKVQRWSELFGDSCCGRSSRGLGDR